MKPAAFDYHAPTTRAEALALLAQYGGDAKVLAGGQSLVPAMNFRLAQPGILVDLNGVADLAGIEPDDGRWTNDDRRQTVGGSSSSSVRIRAMTRQRVVERSALVASHAPLVAEA